MATEKPRTKKRAQRRNGRNSNTGDAPRPAQQKRAQPTRNELRPGAAGLEVTPPQSTQKSKLSEWEGINAKVAPLLANRQLVDLNDDDIKALAKSAGVSMETLRPIVLAYQLSAHSDVAAALLFALIKAGLGNTLNGILAHDAAALKDALQAAVARTWIPKSLSAEIAPTIQRLDELRYRYGPLPTAARELGLKLPTKLSQYLTAKGIVSLEDVRNAGYLGGLPDLPVAADEPALKALGAAAQFTALADDAQTAKALLKAGYFGIADIGRSAPQEFARRLAKDLPAAQIAELRDAGKMRYSLIGNYLADSMAAMTIDENQVPSNLLALIPQTCHCCADATSQIAYLADLLDYTVRHVKYNNGIVDLAFLGKHLHQPFSGLPIVCEKNVETVRQVRICIEVLRDILPPPQKTFAPQFYLEKVYRRLLDLNGTSFDEIRSARVMSVSQRNALAARLQVYIDPAQPGRPDRLDDLFQDPDGTTLTESWLEGMWGLRSTARSPLDPPLTSCFMLEWRLDSWQRAWRSMDSSNATSPLGNYPLLDPDIVGYADLADGTTRNRPTYPNDRTQWTALDFLEQRQNLFDLTLSDLQTLRKPAGAPPLTFSQMMLSLAQPITLMGLAIGVTADLIDTTATAPAAVLKALHVQHQNTLAGRDITAWLTSVNLTPEEFELLARMTELQLSQLPITESEWLAFNAVMVQRAKKSMLVQWLIEERAARNQITLTSKHFRMRPIVQESDAWHAVPYRSDPAIRRTWENTLRGRLDQEQAVRDAAKSAVDTVEHECLEMLREDRLGQAGALGLLGGGPAVQLAAQRKWFTNNILIDGETSACAMTTRIEQAIETLQGLLFGIRNGLLSDTNYDIDDPDFDAVFQWLGAYDTWRAAMSVFIAPENVLRPTLRKLTTQAFAKMVEDLRNDGRISPDIAHARTQDYEKYFADVCNLQPLALYAGGSPVRTVFAIGQSNLSGDFLFSSWQEQPGYGLTGAPQQTPWAYLGWGDDLADKEQHATKAIKYVLPYRDREENFSIAVFAKLQTSGQATWAEAIWKEDGTVDAFSECDVPPPILISEQRPALASSTAPNAPAVWTFSTADQICVLDDGTGSAAPLLLYSATIVGGQRKLALAHGDKASLIVGASVSLDQNWTLPDFNSPVCVQQRVLVVNYATSQLGWVNYSNNALQLERIQSSVTGPAGTWSVALGSATRRTQFRTANLEGGGNRLLAFEYRASPNTNFQSPVRTFVNVFSFGATVLNYDVVQALDCDYVSAPANAGDWHYSPDSINPDGVFWQTVLVARSGFGPSGSSNAQRDDILLFAPSRMENYRGSSHPPHGQILWTYGTNDVPVQALLRWDSPTQQFVLRDFHWTIPENNAASMPGPSADTTWSIDKDDQFFAVKDFSYPGRRYRFIVSNPTTNRVALIDYDNGGQLKTTYLADKVIGAATSTWRLASDDALLVARMLHENVDSLVITNPTSGNIGVFEITSTDLTPVFLQPSYRLNSPSVDGVQQIIQGTSGFHVGDIDGDKLDEIVVLPDAVGQPPWISIWHGLPTASAQQNFRGPMGVTEFDLDPTDISTGALQARAQRIKSAYVANLIPGEEQNQLYLDEAYYYLPMELAVRLSSAGYYESALDHIRIVFDYEAAASNRNIAYKLVIDAGVPTFARLADWINDPLDPHAIAATRKLSYLKYTILTTVQCLLAWGDNEFTAGTSESVNLARELYLKALDLLNTPQLMASSVACDDLIGELQTIIGDDTWVWPDLVAAATEITDRKRLAGAIAQIKKIMGSTASKPLKLSNALSAIREASAASEPRTIGSLTSSADALQPKIAAAALGNLGQYFPELFAENNSGESGSALALLISKKNVGKFVPAPSVLWCIRPNPQFDALHRHADANLRKLRNCRNIAGMQVVMETAATPSAAQLDMSNIDSLGQLRKLVQAPIPPLPYRYATLIERAKELVEIARQIEGSMLATLELEDQKRYELKKAQQDLSLAYAGVRLHDLQVIQAGDATRSASLQRDQAQIQVDEYNRRLKAGLSVDEQAALATQLFAASNYLASGIASAVEFDYAGMFSGTGQAFSTLGGVLTQSASYDRRAEDWQLQARLGEQQTLVGDQQIVVAQDQEEITGQEREIAAMQADQAATILNFLSTGEFLNLDLYEWMSGVLEGIYRYFLQQATSIAQMAESQLAFERQQNTPTVILDDYWVAPEEGMSTNAASGPGQTPDVKGLTGSARLLRDIYELDQYAFTTNQRKLQLSETISLAQLDPIAFQQFRATGTLIFETPMEIFDRKFPGHYLRLISKVRTSVVALIPANLGIRATLSNSGMSQVIIGQDVFQAAAIRRPPESVALSVATNASGLFELDTQPELLIPFEGFGVDTRWQLDMPKPANPFDYDSIADVLFTIDYTALNSYDYREQVLEGLKREVSADRTFSFRGDFADAWYQLNNPDVCAPPAMTVSFEVAESDFPPNLDTASLLTKHIALYFVPAKGSSLAIPVNTLTLKAANGPTVTGTAATSPASGILSTRTGTAVGWTPLLGHSPVGQWQLELTDSTALRALFSSGQIREILFVLSYETEVLPWPR